MKNFNSLIDTYFKDFIYFFSGHPKDFPLEHRTLNIASLIAFVFICAFNIAINLLLHSPMLMLFLSINALTYVYFYYRSKIKGEYQGIVIPWFILTFFLFNVIYFFSDGWKGTGTILIFYVITILLFHFTDSKKHILFGLLIIVNLAILMIMDYVYPDHTYHFPTDKIRFVDDFIVVICSFFAIILIINTFKRNFELERRQVAYQNISLKVAKKQAETALQRQRELTEMESFFISMASHQFKTPLAIIKSNIQILQKISSQNEEMKKNEMSNRAYQGIEYAVGQMNHLLQDVLYMKKTEQMQLHFVPTRLSMLCHELSAQLQISDKERRRVEVIMEGTEVPIYLDTEYFKNALSNLFSNALKYSEGQRAPIIFISYYAKNVFIRIKDFGIGISQGDMKNLFHPFYRGQNVKQLNGSGLGLSISKIIIEKHHGKIRAFSQLERGTTICINLPYEFANLAENEEIMTDEMIDELIANEESISNQKPS
ncbi:sensor histidine kinase [Sediminitomix flava]|uniref:sensor histidine kinase n=1 Tax=Sediminitomix flava TaxID=379075 RepID=UPI0011B1C640|nr:HAMP domain-containing sensor histidine kinase [Sediminitomix flava]